MLHSRDLLLLLLLTSFIVADEEIAVSSRNHRIQKRSIGIGDKLGNRTLNIVAILSEPYMMMRRKQTPEGSEQEFEGLIPDIVSLLSERLNFRYKFYIAPDGKYGSREESGKWNGMIGELIKNENDSSQGADIATAPLTMTSIRERFVNFVEPFQHSGLQVVIRKRVKQVYTSLHPYSFDLLQPIDPVVWGLVLIATIMVGLLLWMMNRYNPYEWAGKHTAGLGGKNHADTFNLTGSMWFVFNSLQWQGFKRPPRSIASRFLCIVWFTFVTILLVTYTAGVVNNFHWASMFHRDNVAKAPTYTSLAHLVASNEYDIITLEAGSTFEYVRNLAVGEEYDVIRASWKRPDGHKLFVPSIEAGVLKMRTSTNKEFAMIMQSTHANFLITRKPCNLQTVGKVFRKFSNAFAVPRNSLILEELNARMLELHETEQIDRLERKWYKSECFFGDTTSSDRKEEWTISELSRFLVGDKPKSVDIKTFCGTMMLLGVGLAISLIIAGIELIYYRQWPKSSNESPGQQSQVQPPQDPPVQAQQPQGQPPQDQPPQSK